MVEYKVWLPHLIRIGVVLMFGFILIGFCALYIISSNSVEKASYVDFKLITLGLINSIMKVGRPLDSRYNFSSDTVTFDTYRIINPFFLANHGYGYIELFSEQVISGNFRNPKIRPYHFTSFFRTKIDGENYRVLYVEWLNHDKTIVFIPFVVKESVFNLDRNYYMSLISQDSNRFPSPIFIIKNMKACQNIYGAGVKYCEWYFDNISKYEEIYNNILMNKKIPDDVSRFPLLVRKTALYE